MLPAAHSVWVPAAASQACCHPLPPSVQPHLQCTSHLAGVVRQALHLTEVQPTRVAQHRLVGRPAAPLAADGGAAVEAGPSRRQPPPTDGRAPSAAAAAVLLLAPWLLVGGPVVHPCCCRCCCCRAARQQAACGACCCDSGSGLGPGQGRAWHQRVRQAQRRLPRYCCCCCTGSSSCCYCCCWWRFGQDGPPRHQ